MKRTSYNNQGFTLMELLVAMTVFLVVIGLSSGIFIQTLRSQRVITRFSENMNNITVSLEQIAREVRTGFDLPPSTSDPYQKLTFRNGYGNYVSYMLLENEEIGSIGRCESFQSAGCQLAGDFESLTSPDVDIENLIFFIQNDETRPPLVTIAVETLIDIGATLTLQTSVSSRIID